MKISQETYDETLLENEEVFSLSQSEAIDETISQFKQQGITDLSSYIATSHPESKEGKEERQSRSYFIGLLNKLDSYISADGKIMLSTNDSNDDDDNIVNTIEEIHAYYRHGVKKTTDNEIDEGVYQNDPIPFLTLTQSNSSLYTFMNLLSIIDLSRTETNVESNDDDKVKLLQIPTTGQRSTLHSTLKLLITILSPRNNNEKEIKMNFKDSFVCMERMVGLIVYHMVLLKQLIEMDHDANDIDIKNIMSTLTLLIKCAMNSCKNCEKNKVLFVRCLKASRVSESVIQLIEYWNVLKSSLPNGIANNSVDHHGEIMTEKKQKESTIGILSNLVTLALLVYNQQADKDKRVAVNLMAECCKIVTVLCRFDDFRTSQQSNETANHASITDSSYGGASSAHDHVLEFNREGIIPTLHELILISLSDDNQQSDVVLAAAAMSATRVLAVNDEIVQALVAVGVLKSVKLALDMGVTESMNNVEKEEEPSIHEDNNEIHDSDTNEQDISDNENKNKSMYLQRQQLATGAIGLIRNVCGNDEIKTTLCLGSSTSNSTVPSVLPSIIQAMSIYKDFATLQEHGCGALAAMALRKPSNALRIVHENGASSILTAMKLFPTNVLVQRQGALAIRNIVSRLVANTSAIESIPNGSTENGSNGTTNLSNNNINDNVVNVRDIFLDLGAEVVLRGITGRHQGSVDEAYAALRDLGCPVSMLKYDAETQTATSRTVMFGDVKPKFRAVYDESSS